MSKVAHYLQEHLLGEVMTSPDARRYFSTDASVLSLTPAFVVYPRNENDVRKAARFTWQLAERGRVIPMVPRGAGTDTAGAALTNGIVLSIPAHMHRIVELDDKSGVVIVEAGANYGKVQQALQTHDRFLPPYPASMEYCTIGGAVANNTAGEKSVKYGDTREYVRGLRIVLANGEIIETGRLKKSDFNKKLGLATFEGEIYRAIDALLEENTKILEKSLRSVTRNSAGYSLLDIKRKDGSFDLTPLFVGSQGTLGIITEVTFDTEPCPHDTTLLVSYFDSLENLQSAILELRELPDMPSSMEMVDENLLNLVSQINPNQLKSSITAPFPRVVLLVEFDDPGERAQRKMVRKAKKILDKYSASYHAETEPEEQEKYWKIRQASATIIAHSENGAKALPMIEDGIVPPERFREFLEGIYELLERHRLQAAVWGHAGDANLHVQPFLDMAQIGDRQKAFRLMEEYYDLVIRLGGSTSAEDGDGRLRGPYLQKMYGDEMYGLFQKVKLIFDPYSTLNPGVKINVDIDTVKTLLRSEYSLEHLYDHMPRS